MKVDRIQYFIENLDPEDTGIFDIWGLNLSGEEKRKMLDYSLGLIKKSEEDIVAANVLYSVPLYSQAVYHLQQAVEKVSKAYAVGSFQISQTEARKPGHISPAVFLKALNNHRGFFLSLNNILKHEGVLDYDCFDPKIFEYNRYTKEFKKSSDLLATISSEDIDSMLSLYEKYSETISSSKMTESIENLTLDFLEDIKQELENDDSEQWTDVIKLINSKLENVDTFLKNSHFKYVPLLYPLSLVTYPHWNSTRYNDATDKKFGYNESLGIVQCFNRLLTLTEEIKDSVKEDFESDLLIYQ
ncbi:HEPN domain-containing protein [Methanococcoides methylutens]|uniref:HEPN domain-containing protein n=1 Tax=Methanococcoides methylutens MM1 TaxID=1434104 RepID=A0A0E3WZ50_METMT|nr:HEPN domain-containing protein [Methanococcoides methylutens]AKB84505.1 hypothetical protein MCMEM_0452 [Methanococcoides methylutens MM1]